MFLFYEEIPFCMSANDLSSVSEGDREGEREREKEEKEG